jgi:hypothetical protein
MAYLHSSFNHGFLILLLLLFFVNGITLQAIVRYMYAEENVSAMSVEVKLILLFVRSIEQSIVNVSQSHFLNLKI